MTSFIKNMLDDWELQSAHVKEQVSTKISLNKEDWIKIEALAEAYQLPVNDLLANLINTALKEVLANLVPDRIVGTIQGDFIEFRSSDKPPKVPKATNQSSGSPWGNLPNMDNLKDMAQSYMSQMNPEQIKEMLKTVANMSDEEKKNILKTFSQQFSKDKP